MDRTNGVAQEKLALDPKPCGVQLYGNQAAVDRIRRTAVEDLMLSQEYGQKGIDQFARFHMKLLFSVQVRTG